jgi:hypothetical protein
MSTSSKPVVLPVNDWDTSAIKYMAPKINDKGGKSINIISKQTNRSLHISTPLMMSWGISDFIDEKGDSDGKYSISLQFPNSEYSTPSTNAFLQKVKNFENQILDDAVKNSELWFGEEMSREVCKHMFFTILKYSKNKDTKKIDTTKAPSIRAKVPFYSGKWAVELYDTQQNLIFPCENEHMTPVDFVPKMSNVACVLQCGGLWIGGKGFGVTWKMIQSVVKPREIISVYGKCHIQLSVDEIDKIEKQVIEEEDADEVVEAEPVKVVTTLADDTDDEQEPEPVKEVVVVEPTPIVAPAAATVAPIKKIVKKAEPVKVAEELPASVVEPVVAVADPAKKKTVIKKKV